MVVCSDLIELFKYLAIVYTPNVGSLNVKADAIEQLLDSIAVGAINHLRSRRGCIWSPGDKYKLVLMTIARIVDGERWSRVLAEQTFFQVIPNTAFGGVVGDQFIADNSIDDECVLIVISELREGS